MTGEKSVMTDDEMRAAIILVATTGDWVALADYAEKAGLTPKQVGDEIERLFFPDRWEIRKICERRAAK